jgi:D-psicose/D-tagatose/L-ribulose 3-epimerase
LVGHTNLFLHLDTFHMSIDEANPFDAITAAVPHLSYFELDQSHRGPAFEGSLDLVKWCRHAAGAGYAGIVGVEAFSRQRLAPDHANALAIWQERFEDGDRVAEEFMQIIRTGFAP